MQQCHESSHNRIGGTAPRVSLVAVPLLSILLTVSMPWHAHAGGVTVSGTVRDTDGMPVHGALVKFTDQLDPSRVFGDSTNAAGQYEVIIDAKTAAGGDTRLQPVPPGFEVLQNYPNPFNPCTILRYESNRDCHIRLAIHNVLGQLVRTLVDQDQKAGRHQIAWNGRDNRDMALGAGVYLCRVEASGQVQARKMAMIDGPAVSPKSENAVRAVSKQLPTSQARAYTVSITGKGILPFSRSDVSVWEDVQMDFEVMRTNIRWLGHASIKILGEKTIYIDPWKLKEPQPADLILITHSHSDHCSPDDVAKIQTDSTVIVTVPDCAAQLTGELRVIAPGDSLTVNDIEILAVPAYNPEKRFHPKANGWVGYVVSVNNMRLYHAGDTDLIPEMADVDTDVALLPIGGTYTMDARQAADAANLIKPKLAIPIHFGDIVGSSEDARLFAELCDVPVEILQAER